MAGASLFSQVSCNSVLVTQPRSQFSLKPALFPANSVSFASVSTAAAAERAKISGGARRILRVRAVNQDEWGPERDAGPAVAVAEEEKRPTEVDLLKKQLVDSFYGTDRGLKATSETRAEVVELITKLEAMNPTPAPTEALTLLNGKWILAYTSFVGLYPLLSRTPPLVKVEEISQTIDSENFTVQNSVMFSGPLATTSISTNAKFEVRSPKRVQIKFERRHNRHSQVDRLHCITRESMQNRGYLPHTLMKNFGSQEEMLAAYFVLLKEGCSLLTR
ncbi:fibrillin [Actinidia rufa]|uniref:Fibrillin n=1 Tax=Actinidia rufa TaxID=165716 RepID=A0A7J0EZ51_9ERIC|nr:fibrillin [Actinidia rufa]